MSSPTRSPLWMAAVANSAAAFAARLALVRPSGPNLMLAETSRTSQSESDRSSTNRLTNGLPCLAVTFQSR